MVGKASGGEQKRYYGKWTVSSWDEGYEEKE